jgi:dienelactone hydrolase
VRNNFVVVLVVALAAAFVPPAAAQIVEAPFPNSDCYGPAGNPAPSSQAWRERDTKNQVCAALRNRDQLASPAYGYASTTAFPELHLQALAEQAQDPTNPRGGITTLVPGSRASDPFRTIARWEAAGRGTVTRVEFPAQNGSTLRGYVFEPPASVPKPASGYPGVVITDGSVQGYQQLYFWAAEDLAANGYVAMTYDVQGQGDSDLAGDDCPGDCSGVPYQQNYNFYQGAEDSLSFFLSDANPARGAVDGSRVGLAGHSLGAGAVSQVGQCDARVKAIVAWDNLSAPSGCGGATIAPENQSGSTARVPALGMSNDYGFWTQPTDTAPNAEAKVGGFKTLAAAGVDTAEVVLRGATHLEYTYIPLVLPASRLGERMASYYTVAWFDRYLKGDASGYTRLVATAFDGSADRVSIGAGDFSVERAAAAPTDPLAGNVPYRIAGMPVENALSFYYRSAYSVIDPATGKRHSCEWMTKPEVCPAPEPDPVDPAPWPPRGKPGAPGKPGGKP